MHYLEIQGHCFLKNENLVNHQTYTDIKEEWLTQISILKTVNSMCFISYFYTYSLFHNLYDIEKNKEKIDEGIRHAQRLWYVLNMENNSFSIPFNSIFILSIKSQCFLEAIIILWN